MMQRKYFPSILQLQIQYLLLEHIVQTICQDMFDSTFPKLLLDFRAEQSLELYKNRALNQFLELTEKQDEKQNQSRIYFDDTMFENVDYTEFENSFDKILD